MNKKNNSDTIPTGTDSSLMTRIDSTNKGTAGAGTSTLAGDTSAATANAAKANVDTSAAAANTVKANADTSGSAAKKAGTKSDATKKIKKGKVSIAENTTKNTGDMSVDKEGFYANTEVLPAFPGGQKALENFFEKNIAYPQDATDNNVEGTVLLNFSVDEKGKVYAPKVTSKNLGYGIEPEAIRVFNKMPTWNPGKIKGKNVKTRYTLPVKFQLY